MNKSQLVILLVVIALVYLLLKKADPHQDFKNWLERNPQHKNKLGQELLDDIFIRPGGEDAFDYCWELAVNQTPIPANLLEGNKLLIPLIQAYLREKKGVVVANSIKKY